MFIGMYSSFLLLMVTICFVVPHKSSNGCGYDSCNLGKEDKLNVHIVMHTHDDVGWLKTVDQYFYGARNDIHHQGVQYILDSVIQSLIDNPNRRFIYVEIAFFWRWWIQQTENIQNTVKQLVNEGRLEFISGGWCMNDEATTHYNSIIDQHSLGAEFLRDQFGECARPKIGWQIDPFGHSRELASLFAQMGFDGLFFGRIDYQDYQQRNQTKTMEMIWKGSDNLDRQSWLFTGVLPNGYDPPSSFCYDFLCSNEPLMDDPTLPDYNVPERVQSFIQAAHDEVVGFATNHIIMTMGSDFQYQNANEWFKNMDKLIKYVNDQQLNGSDVNVFYSSPSCYLYALNKVNRSWTSKRDDFFPYANSPHAVWTGYFTSRAALKRYERYSNNILQVTRQLNAFANIYLRNKIFTLSEAMGLAQHHDAISGTERQDVADDYAQRLSQGIDVALNVINNAYDKLLPKEDQSLPITSHFLCQLSNISECLPIEQQDRFTLTLWNPTIHPVTNYIRIPVTNDYIIIDPLGKLIPSDIVPISSVTMNIPGRISVAKNELVFKSILPSVGFNTYYFQIQTLFNRKVKVTHNDICILENQYVRVEFDDKGMLNRIINLQKNIVVSFSNQGFYWYHSFPGNHSGNHFETSGAYVFRPLMSNPEAISGTRNITCTKSEGVQSALIVFNNWSSQQINVYSEIPTVEFEWTIGPIPIDDKIGKEIILRYDTDIQSQSTFYTDANGREILQRKRDFRPTWNYTEFENVSGNYYPVNTRIAIKDQQRQLTILTDRSQGGTSIRDGSIELMIHRRLVYYESVSLAETLNETAFGKGLVVRGKHLLIVETPNDSAMIHRVNAQQLYMNPIGTFSLTNDSYETYSSKYRQTWSALNETMPINIHLLTFDQLGPQEYLMRIEHFFEKNEDQIFSKPVEIDLQKLFYSQGKILNLIELTLNANLPFNEMKRLNWTTNENQSSYWNVPLQQIPLKDTIITLNPMQIKTFQVTLHKDKISYSRV